MSTVWEPSPSPPDPTGDVHPPGSPMEAWAPQHPFAERDFQMPNCLLVIKCSVEVGCGVWQGKVSDKQRCPCSWANSPGATSRLQFWGDFSGF